MRIMYLTQWFEPEPNIVKGVAFVRALEAAGHQVTVVTGLPNYPTGTIYEGYRLRLFQRESLDGVQVVRLPLFPSHDDSSLRRSLNYLSFFVSALFYCLLRRTRYDIAYAYHPPITVGLAAAVAGRVRRLPFVLDVQDLWPDTIAATSMPGAGRLAPLVGRLCRFVHREAAAIIVQSAGIQRTLIERGVPAARLTLIHNWADGEFPASTAAPPNRRFRLVYGGNLGRAQGLEALIDAAAIIEHGRDDIEILLYGSGIEAKSLRDRAGTLGVTTVRFEQPLPKHAIVDVFAQADALLIHLAADPLFAITIPSKTQFYLAMGRPIVAGVAGDAAQLLEQSGAALVVPPGKADALATAICTLADMPKAERDAMARNGQRFCRERLSFGAAMARTLGVLGGINPEASRARLATTP